MEPPGQNEFQFLLVCSFFQPAHLALKPKPLCCLTTLPPRKLKERSILWLLLKPNLNVSQDDI